MAPLAPATPAPAPLLPPLLPPLPADTTAQRRALQEKAFAELAAASYALDEPAGNPYAWFVYPPRNARPPMLVAFGHVEGGVGVISIRGTVTARNWLSDAHVSTTGSPPRHRGFENCWQRLRPQVLAWLERVKPQELNLVGHSLGGAMAQIAAFELAPHWRIGAVVGFGAPLVGRQAFAAAYDAMPIAGRPGVTLADVTTTFVFKSDLVRSFGLPRIGFVRNGAQIVIDENGRQSDGFLPWHLQAFDVAYTAIVGTQQEAGSLPALPAFIVSKPDAYGIGVRRPAPPPPLTLRGAVDAVRPYAEPVVRIFPQAQMALLGIGAAIALFFAGVFLRRDASYHGVSRNYVRALAQRVERWQPLAFQERGEALLAAGRAEESLPYLDAALQTAEAEGRACGCIGTNALIQRTAREHLARAEALGALGRHADEAAELGVLIGSYGEQAPRLATSAEGRVSAGPQIVALQRRARAFEIAGRLPEAIADHRRVLAAAPSFDLGSFRILMDQARRSVGADNPFAIVFQRRKAELEAEVERLQALRQAAFDRALAAAWAFAHARIAACAYQLGDMDTVVAEASAALALDGQDHASLHLRGAARARLKQRDEAIADFSAAIALAPGNASYRYARGNVRLMAGSRIVRAEGDSKMGAIEARLLVGEKELIVDDFRKTLELDPTHAMARTLLNGIEAAEIASAPAPSRPA